MVSPETQTQERAVRGFVAAGSGLAPKLVRPGNDNGPAPGDLYATVLLITADGQGVPYTLYQDVGQGQLDAATVGTVRARYSVQWYRQGARDAARRFSLWAYSPTGLDRAASQGLTVLRVSAVRQIDDIIADAWEERAGLDLDLGYTYTLIDTINTFGAVGVEITAGGLTHTIEVGT